MEEAGVFDPEVLVLEVADEMELWTWMSVLVEITQETTMIIPVSLLLHPETYSMEPIRDHLSSLVSYEISQI
jgi:hypothetical protein